MTAEPIRLPRTHVALSNALCDTAESVALAHAHRSADRRAIGAVVGVTTFAIVMMAMIAWWVPVVYIGMIVGGCFWLDWPLRTYRRGEVLRAESRLRLLESARRMDYGERHGWSEDPPEEGA